MNTLILVRFSFVLPAFVLLSECHEWSAALNFACLRLYYFLCLNSISHFLVHHGVTFLASWATSRFRTHTQAAYEAALNSCDFISAPAVRSICSRYNDDTLSTRFFLHLFPPRPPTLLVRTSLSCTFLEALLVFP